MAHVKIANPRSVIFELIDLHFAVVKAPHPSHELMFTVGHDAFDIVFVQMFGAAEIEFLDNDVFTLVDLELHFDAAVGQRRRLHLHNGIEIAFRFDLTANQRFGPLDFSLVVDVTLFQSDGREKLIFFVFSVSGDDDLGNDGLLFEMKGEHALLFRHPNIFEIPLREEFVNRFIHLFDIDRFPGMDTRDLPGNVGREVEQSVEFHGLDSLSRRQNGRHRKEGEKALHQISSTSLKKSFTLSSFRLNPIKRAIGYNSPISRAYRPIKKGVACVSAS